MDPYHFRLGHSRYEHVVIVNRTFAAPAYCDVTEHPEIEEAPEVSIVVTVHNREDSIKETIETIFALSLTRFEFVLVLDQCTDKTAVEALRTVEDHQEYQQTNARFFRGPLFGGPRISRFVLVSTGKRLLEKQASNLGIRMASAPYVLLVEQDTRPAEMGWDKVLLQQFLDFPGDNLLAVSGRCAADLTIRPVLNFLSEYSLAFDRPAGTCPNVTEDAPTPNSSADRRRFSVRDVAIPGPLMLDAAKVRALGYAFDDVYPTPTSWDVPELCLRGAVAAGYKCGHYPVSSRRIVPLPSEKSTSEDALAYQRLVIRYENHISDRLKPAGVDREVDLPRDFRGNKTIVSAVSANHFLALVQLLRRIKAHEPKTRVVVYDLGLTESVRQNITSWQNVQLRTFNFADYPDYFRLAGDTRGEYAWKPVVVLDVLQEFGGLVLWLDSGNLIRRPLDRTWNDIAAAGAYSSRTPGDIRTWTHAGTLEFLKVMGSLLGAGNCNGAMVGFNANHARAVATVARRWRACALEKACIAPEGSSRANHRQDQAALTVMMRLNGFSCEWNNGVFDAERGTDPEGSMDISILNDEFYPVEWRNLEVAGGA